MPPRIIDFAHAVIVPLPEAAVRSERVFASPDPVPADASPSQAFIAWTGRDPLWSPTASEN